MIHSYKRGIKPLESYAKDIKFLNRKIKFKLGLNVIIGANGTGKTTLINTLAKLFFAYQQGYSKFNGLGDFSDLFKTFDKELSFSDLIEHNGSPLLFNRRFDTGYFDDNNFQDSFDSIMSQNRTSSGELQLSEYSKVVSNFKQLKSFNKLIEDFSKRVNDYYTDRIIIWKKWLDVGKVSDEKIITILLDEPTSNMDILRKFEFWNVIKTQPKDHIQLIITTHDVTPFLISDIKMNIIETEKDYTNKIKESLK